MRKIFFVTLTLFTCHFLYAQSTQSALKAEKHLREDSALINAGASSSQVQQFKAEKALAITKTKQVKADSTLTPDQKETQLEQINAEKNNKYKAILGAEVYRAYNQLKRLKPVDQSREVSKPTEAKFIRACLDSAGATAAQKQQFMAIKREYKDKMKGLLQNSSISKEQKKQQSKLFTREKNEKYKILLGQNKYSLFLQVKKRNQQTFE